MIITNAESLENSYLKEISQFSWNYSKDQDHLVLIVLSEDNFKTQDCLEDISEMGYNTDGMFEIPSKSLELVKKMALFSWAKLNPMFLYNTNSNHNLENIFDASSLLSAAYPLDIITNQYKSNACSTLDPELIKECDDELLKPRLEECLAFAGLGVILMDGLRCLFGVDKSNQEVLETVNRKFVHIG